MKPFLTLGASALLVLTASAAISEIETIREIDVTADLTAIQNADAAAFWSNLEVDLEAAITLRITGLMTEEERLTESSTSNDANTPAPEGARILVDVRELELTNAFGRSLNLGDAVLVGQVNIVDLADNSNADGYELSVTLQSANVVIPEGQTLMLSKDDSVTYHLLVDAFAQGVVDRLN